jgi:mannose-6-phosphate isomerase-like protein (cupin superfamily)
MAKMTTRRNFLRTAPVAAAAGFTLTDSLFAAGQAADGPGSDVNAAAAPFQFFPQKTLDADMKALQAKPGNNNLFDAKGLPLTIVMTTETHHSATEFEWHEGRDHIVQIVDGMTLYEVGGTPTAGHVNKGPGEWLSPTATGTKSILMGKGDMLVIPRGTLHKRSTEDSVTFLLISTPGVVKA